MALPDIDKFGARAMRLSRTYRAVLVFLFVGFLGAAGPAIDADPIPGLGPQLMLGLDYVSQTFVLEASAGQPGSPGIFNFFIASGPGFGQLQVPFTFDVSGHCRMSFPLSLMNNGFDLQVGIQLFTEAPGGGVQESPVWAFTSHNYVVTNPGTPPCSQCPTAPGGWIDWVTWPGTESGPLFPHCFVAIESDEARSSGQPMLALESGPAGSFPIN